MRSWSSSSRADDRLIHATQTAREKSSTIIRIALVHDLIARKEGAEKGGQKSAGALGVGGSIGATAAVVRTRIGASAIIRATSISIGVTIIRSCPIPIPVVRSTPVGGIIIPTAIAIATVAIRAPTVPETPVERTVFPFHLSV